MTIRVALAGAGAFGQKHLDACRLIEGVEVVSLVGRELDKTREAAASKFSVALQWPEPVNEARRQLLQDWLASLPAGHAVRAAACAGQ